MKVPSLFLALPLALAALVPTTHALPPAQAGQLAPRETVSDADRASLLSAVEALRLAATPTEAGFRLQSANGALTANFDGRGIRVTPTAGDSWSWGLELTSFGFPGAALAVGTEAKMRADGNRITYGWTENLDEWYVNDSAGLEHGYTLRTRPAESEAGGPLTFDLDVLGALSPVVMADGRGVRFLDATGVCALTYSGLVVFDAEGSLMKSSFTAVGGELRLSIDEADAVYPLTIDPKIQLAYIKAQYPGSYDRFAHCVAISGDTAVVGSPGEDGASAGVYGDQSSDGISGSGAAYIFVRKGTTWELQAYVKATNPGVWDEFGASVAIDGDTVVVGAPYEDSNATGVGGNQFNDNTINSGAAYVYKRFGLTWGPDAYLKATNTGVEDQFGYSVAVSGDKIVVGAPFEDSNATGINGNQLDDTAWSSGAAYVYTRVASTWSSQLYLKASNTGLEDWFGYDLGLSGQTLVVGAPLESSHATGINGDQSDNSAKYSGAAYVFQLAGEVVYQDAYIKASNTDNGDYFGTAVAIDGATLVIGARYEAGSAAGVNGDDTDNSLPDAGAAYVFAKSGSTWSQQAYLKTATTSGPDRFGMSVAISGDHIVVGAPYERSKATGNDGDQTDTSVITAGAAFRFTRTGSTWSQDSYLKSSNTEWADRFGLSVAIAGDTVFCGAAGEDSGSGGINGDQSDNSVSSSGAAYAFDLNSPWGATQYGPGTGANIADLNVFDAPLTNQFIDFEMTDWGINGICVLILSAAPANLPLFGGTLLVDWNQALYGPGSLIYIPVPVDSATYSAYIPPIAGGLTVFAQAGMFDPGMPSGFAFTNGLAVSICP